MCPSFEVSLFNCGSCFSAQCHLVQPLYTADRLTSKATMRQMKCVNAMWVTVLNNVYNYYVEMRLLSHCPILCILPVQMRAYIQLTMKYFMLFCHTHTGQWVELYWEGSSKQLSNSVDMFIQAHYFSKYWRLSRVFVILQWIYLYQLTGLKNYYYHTKAIP